MEIRVNLQGCKRKELASLISEVFGVEPKYKGIPSYVYEVGDITLDEDATIHLPPGAFVNLKDLQKLLTALEENNFDASLVVEEGEVDLPPSQINESEVEVEEIEVSEEAETEDTSHGLMIQMPLEGFDAMAFENLKLLIASRATLIKKALSIYDLSIKQSATTIDFPWFHEEVSPEELRVFTQFIAALCDMAKRQSRILAVEKPTDNEKFTFRLFLVRLGMKGEEYANARRILLRNMSGNGSVKDPNGKPPKTKSDQPPEQENHELSKSSAKPHSHLQRMAKAVRDWLS